MFTHAINLISAELQKKYSLDGGLMPAHTVHVWLAAKHNHLSFFQLQSMKCRIEMFPVN